MVSPGPQVSGSRLGLAGWQAVRNIKKIALDTPWEEAHFTISMYVCYISYINYNKQFHDIKTRYLH